MIAAEVVAELRSGAVPLQVADIGAGCGVFGLELLHHLRGIRSLDAFEVQDEFAPYFYQNVCACRVPADVRLHIGDVRDVVAKSISGYDVVVANLPFFRPQEARLSPSAVRNQCRFFLNGEFAELMTVILELLNSSGEAYILCRPRSLENELPLSGFAMEKVAEIRQSWLVRFRRQLS